MKFYLLITILFCVSCNYNIEETPEDILSETIFTNIIKDIHLAEGSFELKKNNGIKEAENELIKSYQKIYNTHNVTEENFKKTLHFYSENPDKLEHIYTNVIELLNNENSKLFQK